MTSINKQKTFSTNKWRTYNTNKQKITNTNKLNIPLILIDRDAAPALINKNALLVPSNSDTSLIPIDRD